MLRDRHVTIDWTKRRLYDLMAEAVEWMHEHLHTPVNERAWLEEADNREQPFGPDPLRPPRVAQ